MPCYPAIARLDEHGDILLFHFHNLPICPRDLYVSQSDKHSDLTVCMANRVTVMAVATDFHRDFLIPGHTVLQYVRQRI